MAIQRNSRIVAIVSALILSCSSPPLLASSPPQSLSASLPPLQISVTEIDDAGCWYGPALSDSAGACVDFETLKLLERAHRLLEMSVESLRHERKERQREKETAEQLVALVERNIAACEKQVIELTRPRGASFTEVIESPWFWIGSGLALAGGILLGSKL